MRLEAKKEHTFSLQKGSFRTDETSTEMIRAIIDEFHAKVRAAKAKKAAKTTKKGKGQEPYRQRSIEELHAAAIFEQEQRGDSEGPAAQAYLDALENQAAMAPEATMIEEEARDKTYVPEKEKSEVGEESGETEDEDEKKKAKRAKKAKIAKKKAEAAEEEEAPKTSKRKPRRGTAAAVPKADSVLMEAIKKGDKDKEKNEGQEIRVHIQNNLMWPTSIKVPLDRLYTPHYMWRDRDITQRHVDRIKREIAKTPREVFQSTYCATRQTCVSAKILNIYSTWLLILLCCVMSL